MARVRTICYLIVYFVSTVGWVYNTTLTIQYPEERFNGWTHELIMAYVLMQLFIFICLVIPYARYVYELLASIAKHTVHTVRGRRDWRLLRRAIDLQCRHFELQVIQFPLRYNESLKAEDQGILHQLGVISRAQHR